ncbi:hypothetical protein BGZ57DRAFT_776386 [Hyaloscypha finlandica]|nr:hypothetical protein BGZ57DRAFT_776386 [Hyaloscypha finlandica]
MTSIGKLTATVLSGSQELVATLGLLNFDFSLVKLEAPSQFRGLGAALTPTRREIAEAGSTHVTARKLGALFEDIIPHTPYLIDAYGTRVSEIASSATANPRATLSDGIFADYTGADGTSIWAAATSGSSAISVHLLGCMLARMFSVGEAISIWVEIVEARKKEMALLSTDEPIKLAHMLAAQVVIERNQLAEWDNSARAWLRRADEAKNKEQTRLMLILNNLSIAVNAKINTYASVISAWTTALNMMEELLSGKPQGIQDGSLLLALSCWHLYPDLIVLGHKTAFQNDQLVPTEGKLTLGLERSANSDKDQSGVYWVMSLAHMRYYGPPVHLQRSIATTSSRLSADQLMQVALGSILRGWGFKKRHLTNAWVERLKTESNWVRSLGQAANSFTSSMTAGNDIYHELHRKLFALGHGRGSAFVEDPKSFPPPVFGIPDFQNFIPLLERDEDRVSLLRKYAVRFFPDAKPWEVIIRYRPDLGRESKKVPAEETTTVTNDRTSQNQEVEQNQGDGVGAETSAPANQNLPKLSLNDSEELGIRWGSSHSWESFVDPIKAEDQSTERSSRLLVDLGTSEKKSQQARATKDENSKPNDEKAQPAIPSTSFEYFLGDPQVAALYVTSEVLASYQMEARAPYWASKKIQRKKKIDLDDVKTALYKGGISAQSLDSFLRDQSPQPFYQSLRALALIQDVYQSLPSATINTEVVLRPLHNAKWLKDHFGVDRTLFSKSLSRQQTFACITMLETGTLDLPISIFQNVFAISSGDSLYVAASLLGDPGEAIQPSEVRHVIGNIGRPGINLIVPPTEPQVLQLPADSWRVINRAPYDGTTSNCFSDTSLHLRFSDWSIAIDVGTSSQGRRDVEASLVEGFIQVNDNGRWIADLDILSAFKRGCSQFDHDYYYKPRCEHEKSPNKEYNMGARDLCDMYPMTAIESWEEFLERPEGPAVVRASKNWLARIATAALGVQRHDRVLVGEEVCWECFLDLANVGGADIVDKILFIN